MRPSLFLLTLCACGSPSTEDLLDDVDVDVAAFGDLPADAEAVWELDADRDPALAFQTSGLFGVPANGVWSTYNVRVVSRGDDPEAWEVSFLADMDSIETGVERLDEHIRTDEYLHVAAWPDGTFQSTSVTSLGGDRYRVEGQMTLRGTTRPHAFDATIVEETDAVRSTSEMAFSRWDYGLYKADASEPGADGADDVVTVNYDVTLEAVYIR